MRQRGTTSGGFRWSGGGGSGARSPGAHKGAPAAARRRSKISTGQRSAVLWQRGCRPGHRHPQQRIHAHTRMRGVRIEAECPYAHWSGHSPLPRPLFTQRLATTHRTLLKGERSIGRATALRHTCTMLLFIGSNEHPNPLPRASYTLHDESERMCALSLNRSTSANAPSTLANAILRALPLLVGMVYYSEPFARDSSSVAMQ